MTNQASLPASTTSVRLWPSTERLALSSVSSTALHEEFEKDASRLFIPEDEVAHVSVIELVHGDWRMSELTSSSEIIDYSKNVQKKDAMTILIIHQSYPWGELEISKTAIQNLFSSFNVSHGFWDVLKLFGCHQSPDHESMGGFNEKVASDEDDSFEISFTAKHVEKHGRPDAFDPWSVRQIGVCHKHEPHTNSDVFVLINPNRSLLRRIQELGPGAQVLDVYCLIFLTATECWAQYLAYLESISTELSRRAVLSNTRQQQTICGFGVHFSDVQSIHKIQTMIMHVLNLLNQNIGILDNLIDSSYYQYNRSQPRIQSNKSAIDTFSSKIRASKGHAETVLRKTNATSVLVQSILDGQALETLRASTATTAELAALAREDAKITTKDARRLNAITVLGLLYLPASFVASLLGTQYINVHTDAGTGKISIHCAAELVVFAVLTLVLFTLTAGIWAFWEWRNRVKDSVATKPQVGNHKVV